MYSRTTSHWETSIHEYYRPLVNQIVKALIHIPLLCIEIPTHNGLSLSATARATILTHVQIPLQVLPHHYCWGFTIGVERTSDVADLAENLLKNLKGCQEGLQNYNQNKAIHEALTILAKSYREPVHQTSQKVTESKTREYMFSVWEDVTPMTQLMLPLANPMVCMEFTAAVRKVAENKNL